MDQQSDSESTSGSNTAWVDWFLALKGNEFFCKIDEPYLLDKFNLTGLSYESPLFKKAYDVIIDEYGTLRNPTPLDDEDSDDVKIELDKAAKHFYGLIHSRFILATDFGTCPRVFCDHQKLLPVGLSDVAGKGSVKLYCAACKDVYHPKSQRHQLVDGAYFGTTFPHLLIQAHPSIAPETRVEKYVPKIFGFKIIAQTQAQDESKDRRLPE